MAIIPRGLDILVEGTYDKDSNILTFIGSEADSIL
jgi:hypothetical protein